MTTFRRTVRSFAEIAALHAEETGTDEGYGNAFDTTTELATLDVTAEPTPVDMPEPQTARAAVEMVMQTLFDVFRDTRLEPYAADLAWGFCNSFHVVAKRIEGREDDAARELGELARAFDPSEIYAVEVEEKQTLTRTLNRVAKSWVRVGALFELTSNATGEAFLNGRVDDPSMAAPLPMACFMQPDGSYNVVWSRPQRKAALKPATDDALPPLDGEPSTEGTTSDPHGDGLGESTVNA